MTIETVRDKSVELEIEHVHTVPTKTTPDDIINGFSASEQRRIVRRIDRRLVVTLGVLYCVSLMDRSNLGGAAIAGMTVDMNLIGSRYSIIVLVFFITYVLAQPPAVVAMRKVGPRMFLPTICLLWGLAMICFGFVTNWESLVGLRLLLGLLEAGYFPGTLASFQTSCANPPVLQTVPTC
jgi:sugar phosphate permease